MDVAEVSSGGRVARFETEGPVRTTLMIASPMSYCAFLKKSPNYDFCGLRSYTAVMDGLFASCAIVPSV